MQLIQESLMLWLWRVIALTVNAWCPSATDPDAGDRYRVELAQLPNFVRDYLHLLILIFCCLRPDPGYLNALRWYGLR